MLAQYLEPYIKNVLKNNTIMEQVNTEMNVMTTMKLY